MREMRIGPSMRSAFPVSETIFRRVGKFVYAINVCNPAEHVYSVSDEYDPRGFGGSPVTFKMEDGSEYISRGTWYCAASYLPKEIYEEIKATYLTRCVISHKPIVTKSFGSQVLMIEDDSDIIFMDDEWVLGEFDRGVQVAVEYAHKLSKDVYYWSLNTSGSSIFHTELYDLKRK
jgi:hypothetical protein